MSCHFCPEVGRHLQILHVWTAGWTLHCWIRGHPAKVPAAWHWRACPSIFQPLTSSDGWALAQTLFSYWQFSICYFQAGGNGWCSLLEGIFMPATAHDWLSQLRGFGIFCSASKCHSTTKRSGITRSAIADWPFETVPLRFVHLGAVVIRHRGMLPRLHSVPAAQVERIEGYWSSGPRTNCLVFNLLRIWRVQKVDACTVPRQMVLDAAGLFWSQDLKSIYCERRWEKGCKRHMCVKAKLHSRQDGPPVGPWERSATFAQVVWRLVRNFSGSTFYCWLALVIGYLRVVW